MNSIKISILFLLLPCLSIGQNLESPEALSNEQLSSLTDTVRKFIGTLKSEQYDAAKEFFAPRLATHTTDEQLKQLSSIIKDVEVDLFHYTIEEGMKGAVFNMLHFKYSNDDSTSPQEIIKVLFDEKDKIAGFQPLKNK